MNSKNLQINAAVCDARKVQEETLSGYEKIQLNSALLITNERSRGLFSKYHVQINCANTVACEEDITFNTISGKTTISAANANGERQYLMLNGSLTILPDAGEALKSYVGIIVNGRVYCPDNLAAQVSGSVMVNGKMSVYPADAVILKDSFTLDRVFPLRAQERLYWAAKKIVAVDETLDCAKLAAKGARFASEKALISEALVEELAPLFTDETQIEILPAGTKLVQDDLELTPAALRRCGSRIYVDGDVTVAPECAGLLGGLEALTVRGDVTLPAALEEEFLSIPQAEYEELKLYRGRLFSAIPKVCLDSGLLAHSPEEVTFLDCAKVEIDEAVSPDEILAKAHFVSCNKIECTRAQRGAVTSVSRDVDKISLTDEENDADEDEFESPATDHINAAFHIL